MSAMIQIPIGGIIAWVKSFGNTPQVLPYGWAICNGSTLSDSQSIFNGLALPNLTEKFLRGNSTSGGTGGADSHSHTITTAIVYGTTTVDTNLDNATNTVANDSHSHDGSTDTVNNMPSYYEVVYIIRTK